MGNINRNKVEISISGRREGVTSGRLLRRVKTYSMLTDWEVPAKITALAGEAGILVPIVRVTLFKISGERIELNNF